MAYSLEFLENFHFETIANDPLIAPVRPVCIVCEVLISEFDSDEYEDPAITASIALTDLKKMMYDKLNTFVGGVAAEKTVMRVVHYAPDPEEYGEDVQWQWAVEDHGSGLGIDRCYTDLAGTFRCYLSNDDRVDIAMFS